MRKLYPWLLALLPASGCTYQVVSAGPANFGKYTLDGHATRTVAKAYTEPSRPNGTDDVFIRVGMPPVGVRQEVLYLDYSRPANSPVAAYKPTFLSLNCTEKSVVQGISYNANVRGTLKQTPNGGYSGTFRGTCPGSATRKKSTVKVVFKNVATAAPIYP